MEYTILILLLPLLSFLFLGIAGGPLIIAILIGRFGYRMKLVTYTTTSAKSIAEGKVSEEDVNIACRRILEAK